jgi:hypothetical protein
MCQVYTQMSLTLLVCLLKWYTVAPQFCCDRDERRFRSPERISVILPLLCCTVDRWELSTFFEFFIECCSNSEENIGY